jgi:hypothetical protein
MKLVKESLMYSKYEIESDKLKKSVLVPGEWSRNERPDMKCPKCQSVREGIQHCEKVICKRCKLTMQRFGNSLKISNEAFLGNSLKNECANELGEI